MLESCNIWVQVPLKKNHCAQVFLAFILESQSPLCDYFRKRKMGYMCVWWAAAGQVDSVADPVGTHRLVDRCSPTLPRLFTPPLCVVCWELSHMWFNEASIKTYLWRVLFNLWHVRLTKQAGGPEDMLVFTWKKLQRLLIHALSSSN